MLGFLIGTACLVGLWVTLRRGPGACGAYGAGPWGRRGGPWGGRGFGGFGHRGGRRHFVAFLLERLDTTAAQEKVITAALDELHEALEGQRGELRRTRADIAAATRSPSFDETRLGELFARHDASLEAIRKAFVGALGKIHAVLDDRQRERLADLIEAGPGGFYRDLGHHHHHHGPWGDAAACG
jgi:hypothetical protein